VDLKPRLYVLTAPIGLGKTTFCRTLASQARTAGWDVAGILCPAIVENGAKTGIQVQDLRSEEIRLLAVSTHQPFDQMPDKDLDLSLFPKLGNWLFFPSALTWGREVIAASLPADLLIVDELGPLELVRGEGWANAVEVLQQPAYKIGIVVIRPSLLNEARNVLDVFEVIQADLTVNIDAWLKVVLAELALRS
jgi:nucleoside-triphosphatase